MQKLRIKFWRIENIVLMKVLEQPDCIKRGCGVVFEINGITIKSDKCPSISEDYIFIRGDEVLRDNSVSFCQYETIEEAQGVLSQILECIKTYNNMIKDETIQINDNDVECIIAE